MNYISKLDVFSQSSTTCSAGGAANKGSKKLPKKAKKNWRCSHIFLTAIAWFVNLGMTVIFYSAMCVQVIQRKDRIEIAIAIFDICLWLWLNGALVVTTCMDPGFMPKAMAAEEEYCAQRPDLNKKSKEVNVHILGRGFVLKICRTCHMTRPPRSSHCATCDRCVETFDHHCPWIYNCIGRRNYKQYVILLILVNLHLITILVFTVYYVATYTTKANRFSVEHIVCYIYLTVGSIAELVVGNLTILHFKLVSSRQTTKEYNTWVFTGTNKNKKNPYDNGCCGNWCAILFSPQYPSYASYKPQLVVTIPKDLVFKSNTVGDYETIMPRTPAEIAKDIERQQNVSISSILPRKVISDITKTTYCQESSL